MNLISKAQQFFNCTLCISFMLIAPVLAQNKHSQRLNSDESNVWLYLLAAVCLILVLTTFFLFKKIQTSKKDLKKFREAEQMFTDVINAIPLRVFWKDKKSIFLGCNQQLAEDANKKSPQEVIGLTDDNFIWSEQAELYKKDDQEVIDSGKAKINYEEPHANTDGSKRWVNTSKTPLKNSSGETYGVLGTFEDITNRKNVEEELRLSEERHRSITANIPGVAYQFFAKDNDEWGMNFVSERAKDIFGIDSEPSTFVARFIECVHKDDRTAFVESIKNVIEQSSPWHFDGRFVRPDGKLVYFRGDSIPSRHKDELVFHGILLDVTEKHNIEEQLHHSQKMDAIGKLAGGVAHDFNNMLSGIIMAAEILEHYVVDDPKANKFRNMILDSAEHAAELTQKLLTFGRKNTPSTKDIEVQKALQDAITILENTVDKRISITTEFKANKTTVCGDESHLQNAFLNLGINASHAMLNGGNIHIDTKNIFYDFASCKSSTFDLAPGEYLKIDVKDNGSGITAQNLKHIFEPFFTTKSQGKGTGLGLAAVYGTVQQHKGAISVQSEEGKGTCFSIALPLSTAKSIPNHGNELKQVQGQGTILVVDDEEIIRGAAEAILNELGYTVILAENGAKAIEAFKKNLTSIDLVLLDMIMPIMNGRDCFTKLRELREDIPVIIASGFVHAEDLEKMQENGLNGYLKKPYRGIKLGQTIKEILQAL